MWIFLASNSHDILSVSETNLGDSIDSANFTVRGYLSLIRNSVTHMHGLAVYMEGYFCIGFISRKLCRFIFMFSTGFTLFSVLLFFLNWSASSSLCTIFDAISSNIDEVLSINWSANIFVFGDFNAHHNDWLSYSNDLFQMVIFCTWIHDCSCHSPALLDLFLLRSTMAFLPLGNTSHFIGSVFINFLSNSKRDTLLIAQLMTILLLIRKIFIIIWEMLHANISLYGSVLWLLVLNSMSGPRLGLMYISLIKNIWTLFICMVLHYLCCCHNS